MTEQAPSPPSLKTSPPSLKTSPPSLKNCERPGLHALVGKIHPRRVSGANRNRKWGVSAFLLVSFLLGPWLRWDRGPGVSDQAFLFDFVAIRGHFLGVSLWPDEFIFLTGILIVATIGLFLATALRGRIWCGFACPHTVWTDLFVWIEGVIEGGRNARIAQDKAPLSLAKIARKVAIHLVWQAVSLLTGATFVFYFADAPTSLHQLSTGAASGILYCFVALFSLATYVMAGWAREQVCFYMCPWPRIQGPMLDQHSVVVAYDFSRGEMRSPAQPGLSFADCGHCVDCRMCVQACPTGVDIRDGMQMECINCGLCVDACNSVMDRFHLPRNLIGWRALRNVEGSKLSVSMPWYGRPRIVIYGVVLLSTILVMGMAAHHRQMLDLSIQHDRSPHFVRLSDGSVRNDYTVKIINRDRNAHSLQFTSSGVNGATIRVLGQDSTSSQTVLLAAPDRVTSYRIAIHVARDSLQSGAIPMMFHLEDASSGDVARRMTVFVAEAPQ